MAKTIKTKVGALYSVTMLAAGSVTCERGGVVYTLVTLGAPGQATFRALAERTIVSDDGATVETCNGNIIVEGVSVEAVETMLTNELYSSTTDIPTPEGTEDFNYVCADIPARYVPAGKLCSIVLQGGVENTNVHPRAAYLSVWQEQSAGTDNFQLLAVSTNAVRIAANYANEWFFDKPATLNQRIRLLLHEEGEDVNVYNPQHTIRSRVSVTPKWQDGHVFTPGTYHRLPELVIRMEGAATKYTPAAHGYDTIAHLTREERAGLSELLSRKDEILSMFPQAVTIPEL